MDEIKMGCDGEAPGDPGSILPGPHDKKGGECALDPRWITRGDLSFVTPVLDSSWLALYSHKCGLFTANETCPFVRMLA